MRNYAILSQIREGEGMSEGQREREAGRRVRSGGQETERLKENETRERRREDRHFFLSLLHHPSPVSNTGLVKHHGPNWTNDWAQIRPALMNK